MDLDRRFKDDAELLDYLTTQSFDGTGLKERIAKLYQDGLRDEENVLDTFRNFAYEREDRRDPWVRPSLFLQMFSQDWNEWVCVDTIDAVGRWNIQVFGYSPPKSPAPKNYLKVCHNAYNWRQDQFVADGEIEGDDEAGNRDAQVTEPRNDYPIFWSQQELLKALIVVLSLPYPGALLPLTCVVELTYQNDKKQVLENTNLTVVFVGTGNPPSKFSATAYFPAATLLPDLPRGSSPGGRRGERTSFNRF